MPIPFAPVKSRPQSEATYSPSNRISVPTEHAYMLARRLAGECLQLQWVREYLKNAIEASERQKRIDQASASASKKLKKGEEPFVRNQGYEIIIGAEPPSPLTKGTRKLYIMDLGDGMFIDNLEDFFGQLGLSGSDGGASLTGNFGMGAKISSMIAHPKGVVVMSWRRHPTEKNKNGSPRIVGCMAKLVVDEERKFFGFDHEVPGFDGSFNGVQPINEKEYPLPKEIERAGSGTKIIFLGQRDDEDTFHPVDPEKGRVTIHGGDQWIGLTANSRWFEIPKDITIKYYLQDHDDRKQLNRSAIKGQNWALTECSKIGPFKIPLTGATAHLYVMTGIDEKLPGRVMRKTLRKEYNVSAHTAFIFQDELYDVSAPGKYSRLRAAGLHYNTDRFVLYIEPDPTKVQVHSDTVRSKLVFPEYPDEDVWEDVWAKELSTKLPQEVRGYLDDAGKKVSESDDAAQMSYDELKRFDEFLRREQGIASSVGEGAVEGEGRRNIAAQTPGNTTRKSTTEDGSGEGHDNYKQRDFLTGGSSDDTTGRVINKLGRLQTKPQVIYKGKFDNERDEEEMKGVAAEYNRASNTLYVNTDFPPMCDWVTRVSQHYTDPDAPTVTRIRTLVKVAYTTSMLSLILANAKHKGHTEGWKVKEVSDEHLTVVVLNEDYMRMKIWRAALFKLPEPQIPFNSDG